MVAIATREHESADPQTILDLLPTGVFVVNRDWRIAYANPEADRMLGGTGTTLWERCPALEHSAFASGFRYAMSDRTELLTESVLPSVGWCQARARPMPQGGLVISLRQVHAHTLETGQARAALLLGEIGDALTREDSLRAALSRCAAAIIRHLGAALAEIWTVDVAAQSLELCTTAGLAPSEIDDSQDTLRFGLHKIGTIAETGEPYLTNEAATDPHLGRGAWIAREHIVAFAGYPLRIEDRIVGVMAMYSRKKIDHDTLNGLSAIADSLALGISSKLGDEARRSAEAALRKHAGDLAVMHELGKQLSALLERDALAQRVVDATTRLAGAQAGVFAYHVSGADRERDLEHAVSAGGHTDLAAQLPVLAARTLADPQPVCIADLRDHASEPMPGGLLAPARVAGYLAVPVLGRSGRLIGALAFGHTRPGAFTEETQRLIAGVAGIAAIAMDNARLFQEAHDLIAALETSNRELDQFAYVASHDLKAPLRGIANLSQWIEDDLGDRMDDQTRTHIHLLRGRVIRLENLIGGILAYSRAGRDSSELATIDLAVLAGEVWELLAPPDTARLQLIAPLPVFRTSRVQLQQILMNLMGNAIKHNPERQLCISLAARRVGRRWEITVSDDGAGIAPEFTEKVWGLFQTLERRDKLESTGIGLSVVRKIVEGHGGRAWLDAASTSGAVFRFTWAAEPAGSAEPAESTDPAEPEPAARGAASEVPR